MAVGQLDRRAVGAGTLVALAIAAPPALIAQALTSVDAVGEDSGWLFLFLPVVFAGFTIGGYTAARRRTDTPLLHGAVAALLAFLVVQVIGVVRQLIAGDEIRWARITFNAMLSACLGAIGGIIAARRQAA